MYASARVMKPRQGFSTSILFILTDFPVTLATPGEDFLPVDDVPIIVLPGRQEPPSIPVRIINDDRTEVTRETVFFFFTTEMPRITTFQDQFSNTFQIIDDDCKHSTYTYTK